MNLEMLTQKLLNATLFLRASGGGPIVPVSKSTRMCAVKRNTPI